MKKENKVNLFFIGGMRCGSTTIHMLLNQHPAVYMSPIKEPRYFQAVMLKALRDNSPTDEAIAKEYERFIEGGNHRTASSFRALFDDVVDERVVGESSHYLYSPEVALHLHKYNPNARILVCLRNPSERMFSEYQLFLRRGTLDTSFKEFIDSQYESIGDQSTVEAVDSRLNKGLYHNRLKVFIDVFGRDKVKVVLFEDLQKDSVGLIKEVYAWLGLETEVPVMRHHTQKSGKVKRIPVVTSLLKGKYNKKLIKKIFPKQIREKIREKLYGVMLKRENMDMASARFLKDYYKEDVLKLEKLLNRDLKSWQ